MNKNKTLFLSAVVMLAVLIVSGLGIFLMKDLTSFQSSENLSSLTLINSKNERFDIEVELAIQPDEVAKGLMHRTELPENAGMLFWFGGREQERRFWMKNTLIPLDMLFIKANGTIHHIHENAVPHDLTGISSKGPVAAVLEINGGLSQTWVLAAGDRVVHPYFKDK